jgi:hypothetical protein
MATFEYLSVFISIVVGLAVVHILRGVVRVFTDPHAKPYWIHTAWLFYLLWWLPFFWWFTFDWRHFQEWTFPVFFFVVAYSMLIYALCVTLLPHTPGPDFDSKEYFFRNHRRIFSLWVFLRFIDIADSFLKGPENIAGMPDWYLWYAGLGIVTLIIAAVTPNPRYHGFLVIAWFGTALIDTLAGFADIFGA